MAWLFPGRFRSDHTDRLDAVMAEHHLANEALSEQVKAAKGAAEADADRAKQIVAASRARLEKQEERRSNSYVRQLAEDVMARPGLGGPR